MPAVEPQGTQGTSGVSSLAYRVRADLRVGWRSLVLVALLIGLAGGAVLGGLAAARRTASAYERMRQTTDAWDVLVNPNNGDFSKLSPARLARVPGIESMGVIRGISVIPANVTTPGQIVSDLTTGAPIAALDDHAGYTVARPVILQGHMPAPTDQDAVYVDRTFASNYHLHVGQFLPLVVMSQQLQHELVQAGTPQQILSLIHTAPAPLHTTVRVAAIGVSADAVVVDQGYAPMGILFTQAFWQRHADASGGWWGATVRLRSGTSVATFTAAVQRLVPSESIAFQRASAVTAEVNDAVEPNVVALEAFAVLAAILGIVVVGQAVSRRMLADARANPTLAAIGLTRTQLAAGALAKTGLAAVVGAGLAVAIAFATSPLAPVGVVRVAEVHPGVDADALVLVGGYLAIVVVIMACAAVPAWRWSGVRAAGPAPRRSRVAEVLAGTGASVPAVLGTRFGLEPGAGRTTVPVRTTLLAASSAVALVTAVLIFSASVDHLVATPGLFGSPWQEQLALENLPSSGPQGPSLGQMLSNARLLDHSGLVARSSVLRLGEVQAGSTGVPAIGLSPEGSITPTVAAGRLPRSADEIALGKTTMARLHTRLGGTVSLAEHEAGPTSVVHVVGQTVLPGLATYEGSDKAGLGVGAVLTASGFDRFSPNFGKAEYVFRLRPGSTADDFHRFLVHLDPRDVTVVVDAAFHPAGVMSVQRLRSTPTVLAGLVVVMLAAAVGNALGDRHPPPAPRSRGPAHHGPHLGPGDPNGALAGRLRRHRRRGRGSPPRGRPGPLDVASPLGAARHDPCADRAGRAGRIDRRGHLRRGPRRRLGARLPRGTGEGGDGAALGIVRRAPLHVDRSRRRSKAVRSPRTGTRSASRRSTARSARTAPRSDRDRRACPAPLARRW